ncbi:hypothetical protein HPP92_018089 [Vanilla planifolia]|uniref:Protein kinase domain-containing protein n=1 Tax=Vanilla planifolia TaxID=51239 RepID=A0A835UKH4_VANPL|nr:hypothetical protein HPP92_018089 [Vanilla planifolia]
MRCFAILRGKKKKDEVPSSNKSLSVEEERIGSPLPEPEFCGPSLKSAPPSFRNRAKPVLPASLPVYGRARALSAPSSLIVTDHDVSSSTEFDEQEESKLRCEAAKEQRFSNPLPLPLPSPRGTSILKNLGSFKSNNGGSPVLSPRTLPLPPLGGGGLRNFTYEEIAAACQKFSADRCVSEGISSTVYKATFGDDSVGSKKLEATVIRLISCSLNLKDFVNTLNTIASLQHPHLCRLLGFSAREGSDQRMLVYEKLYHGSLDRLLFGRSDGPTMDWSARMNIALSAARGLAFLHEEGPFQAMFHEFSSANIQVEKDFSAKLSGYGGVSYNTETELVNTSVATASLSVETLEKGVLTPKSNRRSSSILQWPQQVYPWRHSRKGFSLPKATYGALVLSCSSCLPGGGISTAATQKRSETSSNGVNPSLPTIAAFPSSWTLGSRHAARLRRRGPWPTWPSNAFTKTLRETNHEDHC